MYLYDNLQKFITLDKYNEQKGPPHITAINYAGHHQNKKFILLPEYFYKPPRVLAIYSFAKAMEYNQKTDGRYAPSSFPPNDKIKTIAMGCTDIGDPENNNNGVDFFLKISLFLGMTTASYYFLYFYRKYKH